MSSLEHIQKKLISKKKQVLRVDLEIELMGLLCDLNKDILNELSEIRIANSNLVDILEDILMALQRGPKLDLSEKHDQPLFIKIGDRIKKAKRDVFG